MPKIVLFHGKPRQGKTFIIAYRAVLKAARGWVVLRNYGMDPKVTNSTEISPYGLVRLLDCGRVPYRRLLSLQEAEKWLSSYRSMSDVVIAEASVISQCGKMGISIDADSQLVGKVESALKDNAEERWEAVAFKLCNREKCLGLECRNIKFCKFRYYKLDIRFRDRLVRLPVAPRVFPFRVACRYWDLFDTWSVTEPIGWRGTVDAMCKTEPSLMNERVNELVELLRHFVGGGANVGVFGYEMGEVADVAELSWAGLVLFLVLGLVGFLMVAVKVPVINVIYGGVLMATVTGFAVGGDLSVLPYPYYLMVFLFMSGLTSFVVGVFRARG